MNFDQTPQFKKDLKYLSKRWKSLPNDIKVAERDITPLYVEQEGVDIKKLREGVFNNKRAALLHATNDYEVVKMRLDVAYIKNSDKARIVFVVVKTKSSVIFIELYAKNDKDREDTSRYKGYIK